MSDGVIEKQPREKVPCTVNLTRYLPTGETIQNTSTVVVTDGAGADVSAAILHATVIASPRITAVLKAGTSGQTYTVTFFIKTQNYDFEHEFKLIVKEKSA